MKKRYRIFILSLIMVLLGSFIYKNIDILKQNPFKRDIKFDQLGYATADEENNIYLIDNSMMRIMKISPSGNLKYILKGGSREEKSFYYCHTVEAASDGYLYVLNDELSEDGLYCNKEQIIRYNPEGKFDKIIYDVNYDEDNRPSRQGRICSIQVENNNVYFFSKNENQIEQYKICAKTGAIEKQKIYKVEDAEIVITDIKKVDENSICYSNKRGKIYLVDKNNKAELIYIGGELENEKETSIPWHIGVDSKKNIYFNDLGRGKIYKVDSNNKAEVVVSSSKLKEQIDKFYSENFYSCSIQEDDSIVTINNTHVIRIDKNGKILFDKSETIGDITVIFFKLLVWILVIVFIIVLISLIKIIYVDVMKKRITLLFKQLSIFIPIILILMIIVSNMIINDINGRYEKEIFNDMEFKTQTLSKIIDGDRVEKITKLDNFMNEDYKYVRNTIHEFFNYNKDEFNIGYYGAIYQIKNDELAIFMYYDDSKCIFYPTEEEDGGEEYKNVYKTGEITSQAESDSDGMWMYTVGPIYNSKGEVVAVIEVGKDNYSYNQANKKLKLNLIKAISFSTVIFTLIFLVMTYYLLSSIRKLSNGVNNIARGKWNVKVEVKSNDEISDLCNGFNTMAEYIHNYITEIMELNKAYYRFVPRQFLKFLNKENVMDINLGDQIQKNMSILFSDIRSFTTLSESMTPKENFNFLNSYLKNMGPVIRENKGFVDKYIGDAIMALFPNEPRDAIKAAIEMRKKLNKYNEGRKRADYMEIDMGIGIHTGSLMLGIIGEELRMEGTVISDSVNLASRMEGLTKHYGASILITEFTFKGLSDTDEFNYRFLGFVKVKGKNESIGIYEILDGLEAEIKEKKIGTKDIFEQAVNLYKEKDFKQASAKFKEVLEMNEKDKAASIYLENCEKYKEKDSAADYDSGVLIMKNK